MELLSAGVDRDEAEDAASNELSMDSAYFIDRLSRNNHPQVVHT